MYYSSHFKSPIGGASCQMKIKPSYLALVVFNDSFKVVRKDYLVSMQIRDTMEGVMLKNLISRHRTVKAISI